MRKWLIGGMVAATVVCGTAFGITITEASTIPDPETKVEITDTTNLVEEETLGKQEVELIDDECSQEPIIQDSETTTECEVDEPEMVETEYEVETVSLSQKKSEIKAAQYQVFNMATMVMNEKQKEMTPFAPAIVIDIDNTIIASGNMVPGAEKLLSKCKELGVHVFYVTNRSESKLNATINELEKFNLPYADKHHIKTKTTTSNKADRVAAIKEEWNVLIYVGNDLTDFPEGFDKLNDKAASIKIDEIEQKMGTDYFIIP